MQISFNKLLKNKIPDTIIEIVSLKNIIRIKDCTLAIIDEVMESLREIPWKPWKNINLTFDITKYRMELIDIFHFLINLFLFSGMDSKTVAAYFDIKNQVNIKRQKDGY